MKSRKNYGRKIKRNKLNLYPKKKTKAQKILGAVLTVILLLAIAFFGYCLGKPLLNYFDNNTELGDTPEWTPPEDSTPEEEVVSPEITTAPAETTTTVTEKPVNNGNIYATEVPSAALTNSAALSAYAAKSSAEGFTAAVILMKDDKGNLRYATNLESLQGTEAVIGTLTAEEISSVLKENGLTPIAKVSTLADNGGCIAIPDMSYKIVNEENVSWLDYSAGAPTRWANPESQATKDYIKAITDELIAAGFSEIIQTNIIFPNFQPYDREYIAGKYFDANRYKMLSGVVAEKAYIEVKAEDILSGTTEVLKNKELKNKVLVRISREAFTGEEGYPAEAGSLLEVVMSKAKSKQGSYQFIPLVNGKEFTTDEIKSMKKSAESMGYKEFFIG